MKFLQLEKQHNALKNIPVYYNPQVPDESTLFVGSRNEKGHSDLILAIIAFIAGLAVTVADYLGKNG